MQKSTYYECERSEMLRFVPGDARDILEIGCGAGVFGEYVQRQRSGARVTGIETNAAAADAARRRLAAVIELPAEQAIAKIPDASVDCVICNDVLEHLVAPWTVLAEVRSKLRPGGSVVSSIPNVRYFPVFKSYLFDRNWQYEDDGVMDRTHLRFFTEQSIHQMYRDSGYRVVRIEGIFPRHLPWKAALFNRLTGGLLDDTRYERFASVAIPLAD